MYRIHRWFIRSALTWLLTGSLLGSWLLIVKALGEGSYPYALLPIHTHVLTVGFLLNLIMGVAFWMFPKDTSVDRTRQAHALLPRVAWVCLQSGLLLRIAGEPWPDAPLGRIALIGSAVLTPLAIISFVVAAWRRVRLFHGFPEL